MPFYLFLILYSFSPLEPLDTIAAAAAPLKAVTFIISPASNLAVCWGTRECQPSMICTGSPHAIAAPFHLDEVAVFASLAYNGLRPSVAKAYHVAHAVLLVGMQAQFVACPAQPRPAPPHPTPPDNPLKSAHL